MNRDGRRHWDERARSGTVFTAPEPDERFARLADPCLPVLDVGCGYGRTLAHIGRLGFQRLVGLDFSPAMLRRVRSIDAPIMPVMGDAASLPFTGGSFGAVLTLGLFTCITDSGSQRAAAGELFRVLKPGGLLFASLFLLNRDRRNRQRYLREAAPRTQDWGCFRLEDGVRLRHHAMADVRRLFRRFEWIGHEVRRFRTMGGHHSRGLVLTARRPG